MNNRNIEQALDNAMSSAPAIPFEELAAMEYVKLPEHDYITKQEEKARPSRIRSYTLAAACCLLLLLSVTGWYRYYQVSDSIIMLDVNPSIEIRINHSSRILSVTALNQDAGTVLKNSDFKGKELSDTVASIIDLLVKHQYLNTNKNAILLTVINHNNRKADTLLKETASTIKKSLTGRNIQPTIIKQIIKRESDRSKLAEQYHISEGKINLIQEMVFRNHQLSMNQLAKMSIQQLLQLAKENSIDLRKYFSDGDRAAISAPERSGTITKGLNREDASEQESGNGIDRKDRQQDTEDSHEESDFKDGKGKEYHEDSGEAEEDGDTNGDRDYKDREEDDRYHKSSSNRQNYEERNSSKNSDSDEQKENWNDVKDQEREDRYSDNSSGTQSSEDQQNQRDGSQNEGNQDQEVIYNENQKDDEPDREALNERDQSSDERQIESQDSENQSEDNQNVSEDNVIQYQAEMDNSEN